MPPRKPDAALGLGLALRVRTAQIGDALEHYTIGYDARAWGLPVDWEYVARRMAEALGWEGSAFYRDLPPERDFTREPEDDDADPELTARMGDGN